MGYEARQEAMNELIAERARELMPDEEVYTLDEDIPGIIADGVYDIAVLKRAAAILAEHGFPYRELDGIVMELEGT